MKTSIVLSALVVASLGTVLATPKTAAAGQWVGSGWNTINVAHGASVVGSNGGTYSAVYEGTSVDTASYNSTGSFGGLPTCDEAALLCADQNIIIAPYLCESAVGGTGTITDTAAIGPNSQGNVGYYYVWQGGNTWTLGTDTGYCPSGFGGIFAGVFLYQW